LVDRGKGCAAEARKEDINVNTKLKRGLVAAIIASFAAGAGLVGQGTQLAYGASPTPPVPVTAQPTPSHVSAPAVGSSPTPGPGQAGGNLTPSATDHPRGIVPHAGQGQPPTGTAPPIGLSANPQCPPCTPPLVFHRGTPVIGGLSGTPGHVTITPVYWGSAGSYTTTYKSVINGYIQNVATASQPSTNTNVFSVGTQYYQQATPTGSPIQHIQYVVQAGSEIDDTTAFPAQGGSTGCTADAGFTACVTDVGLQTELQARLTSLSLPIDDSHLYMVLFPQAVETCIQPGSSGGGSQCNTNFYCAYHSSKAVASSYMIYGNEPYPLINQCALTPAQSPNGDAYADAQVSLISHEANEAITDWGQAWYDSAGYENGDECNYVYGAPIGSTGGSNTFYNQVIGSGRYYTQDEFSNEDYALGIGDPPTTGGTKVPGCVQRDELPTASFSGPSSVAAGASATFNGSGSSDPDNTTALTYSWSWGDGPANSTGAAPSHVFSKIGTNAVTLTVADVDGWSGTVSHSVAVAWPTSSSTMALQHPSADKVAYLHDGSLLEGFYDGTKGVIEHVTNPSTAPAVTQVQTIPGDEVTMYTLPGSNSTDIWIQVGNELVMGSVPLEQIQHGTYDGTNFTWDTLTTIPGAISPGRQDPSVTWTGKWVIASWWDDTMGSNSDNVFVNWTTDKTGKTGWLATAIMLTNTVPNTVQVSIRHSAKLGATIAVYGAKGHIWTRTLLDSKTNPSLANWSAESMVDPGYDDYEGNFGGPQIAIDESSGNIHVLKALTTLNGPTWSGITYWLGKPDAVPMVTGTVTWNPRLVIDSTGTTSTDPPDIAGAVDSSGKVYVFWTTKAIAGAIKYVTLVSPFTSASSETTLATTGTQPRYPHVPAQSPLNRGYVPVVYQTGPSSPFSIVLDTSIAIPATTPWVATYSVSATPPSWGNNQTQSYSVTITNKGSQTWAAGGSNPVHLGVHFATAGGGFGAGWYTDQRFSLPADLAPGASVTLSITVTAPANTGNLVLEYEMVKEQQFWFVQFADVSVTVSPPWVAAYSVSGTPTSWSPGQSQTYSVTITNNGSQTWAAGGSNPVHLGVHFATAGGGFGAGWYTDQRFSLPADLAPGASVTLSITVTAPANTGNLVLDYEMVKEQQFWFVQFADVSVTVT
jgi:hypothetical protein